MDHSQSVQQMAYHMLREAAEKHTEHVVIEAAVDTEAEVKPELPPELIDILHRTIEQAEEADDSSSQVSLRHNFSYGLLTTSL